MFDAELFDPDIFDTGTITGTWKAEQDANGEWVIRLGGWRPVEETE